MTHHHSIFGFEGIASATVCSIDLNPFDEGGLFGSSDNEKAKKLQQKATNVWTGGAENPLHPGLDHWGQPIDNGMFGEVPSLGDTLLGYGGGADQINPYSAGPGYTAAKMNPWDPGVSAYDTRGPSAYGSMDPSAYGGLSLDPEARKGMTDSMGYFQGIEKDPIDAIAEADYAKRAKQAELSRRSNSEAAIANAEARGQAGSGDALLAQIENAQGAASDRYSAGLDTAATAQARRDAAATSAGSMASTLGQTQAQIDEAKAAGLEGRAQQKAAGYDLFANNTAAGKDAWDQWNATNAYNTNKYNADATTGQLKDQSERQNSVSDANTAGHNQTVTYNRTQAPQQHFTNTMGVAQGATGQMGTQSGQLQQGAVYPFQDVILPAVSAGAKAAAGAH